MEMQIWVVSSLNNTDLQEKLNKKYKNFLLLDTENLTSSKLTQEWTKIVMFMLKY